MMWIIPVTSTGSTVAVYSLTNGRCFVKPCGYPGRWVQGTFTLGELDDSLQETVDLLTT